MVYNLSVEFSYSPIHPQPPPRPPRPLRGSAFGLIGYSCAIPTPHGHTPSSHPHQLHTIIASPEYANQCSLFINSEHLFLIRTKIFNGITAQNQRASGGHETGGTRTTHGQITDGLRTGYGLHTDETRTSYGQNTDGPRFGLRVGSWILVFWKRRAGEIATRRICGITNHMRKIMFPATAVACAVSAWAAASTEAAAAIAAANRSIAFFMRRIIP